MDVIHRDLMTEICHHLNTRDIYRLSLTCFTINRTIKPILDRIIRKANIDYLQSVNMEDYSHYVIDYGYNIVASTVIISKSLDTFWTRLVLRGQMQSLIINIDPSHQRLMEFLRLYFSKGYIADVIGQLQKVTITERYLYQHITLTCNQVDFTREITMTGAFRLVSFIHAITGKIDYTIELTL